MSIVKHLSRFHPKHYPARLFKELTVLVPLVLLVVLTLNLSARKNNFDEAKDLLQQNSQDTVATIYLANQLLLNNQLPSAEKLINRGLQGNQKNTGLLEEKLHQIMAIKSSPEILKEEILAWENIVHEYPLYRDAHLKLAILNLRLGRSFAARKHIVDALGIDPNNPLASEMLSVVEVQK